MYMMKKNNMSVMFVGSLFPGEVRRLMNHAFTDFQIFDWTIRILTYLSSAGYRVYYKPHPAEAEFVFPPYSIEKITGCKLIETKFERCYKKVDIIILDCLASTILKTLTKNANKFIYIDFDIVPISDKAFNLLSEDCDILRGTVEDSGKLQVDFSLLDSSIIKNKTNKNAFYNYFYKH